ncbi:cobalamin biosynthesis protein CobW [Azospirillum thiophilum]|uniref:Cobalamin biosynthesis protein CobW n=1 Tax=Azospirillum thiophilum TaxID=528244 RepID=A0AAC8W395_9PROT|nr:cobalamin biosynthesis protein CobW [Azospirillum thiophilum]ALG74283.1 cobalamin biosynthesis protein CobW [Azospirillum thiophilum]KJR63847.1 cobalamin biosynthesis protein CobW [Azospirillum thiophilum]
MSAPAKTVAGKVPATVITGFLGAGKTTLIRGLLEKAEGRRLALIINEFGDVGIDGDILRACGSPTCTEDDVIELANGCLCCTVADDFVPAIEKLLARPQPPEHIVIETSGLALPKPLVQAFHWPAIKSRVTVDGVIAVVDAAAAAEGRFAPDPAALAAQRDAAGTVDHETPVEEVFEDQLLCADLIVVNKTDLVDAADLARVEDLIREALGHAAGRAIGSGAKLVRASQGSVDPLVLLGVGAAVEDDLANRPSHHDDEEGHDHDDFTSFVVELPSQPDPAALVKTLEDVAALHGVLRLKGFIDVPGKPMRLLVQGVGIRVQSHYDRLWKPGEERRSRLVVIGETGLDREAVTAAVVG